MKISTYKSQLPILHSSRVVPLVWGAHGIGKSSVYEDYYTINLRLGNMEVGDIVGFPVEREGSMSFLAPDWWARLEKYCELNPDKTAILHLDEINHIRKDMQSIIFQLVLDRRVNERVLPSNCQIVASANPPTEDYPGVFDFTNLALLDRFCHISLTPTVDEWAEWAVANDVDRDRVQFLIKNPVYLEMVAKFFDATKYAKPSRRSQAAADRLEKLGAVDEVMYGMVGVEAHEAFKAYKAAVEKESVTAADIFAYKKATREKIRKMREAAEMATLGKIVDTVAADIKTRAEDVRISKKEADGLAKFIMDLPLEMAHAAALTFTAIPQCEFEIGEPEKQPELFEFFVQAFKNGELKAGGTDVK